MQRLCQEVLKCNILYLFLILKRRKTVVQKMRMSSMDMSIMRIVYGHGAGLIEHARASPGEEGIMPDNREFIAAVRKEWERFQRGESVNPGVEIGRASCRERV